MNIYEIELAFQKAFRVTSVRLPFTALRAVFIPDAVLQEAVESGGLERLLEDVKRQLPKDAVAVETDAALTRGVVEGRRLIFYSTEWPQHESRVIPEIGLKFEGIVYEKA